MDDVAHLREAIAQSRASVEAGGFPIGAVVVKEGVVLGWGVSDGKQLKDPTNHAEIAAIREACKKIDNRDLKGVTLYSSLEPCLMCFAAAFWAHIPRIVYACRKGRVSKQHSEGTHDIVAVNEAARRHIELVHLSELEREAAKVIDDWEASVR
ncbi:MAG: nucleoside deaminase [Candidatus Veblenbacteria bacterium]|nr:nucleoside deaminase [Candidatus Veblenbacteria bacterium]